MSPLKMPATDVTTPALIIFDCDGVLVDSETLANTILTRHLRTAGVTMTEAQVEAMFRGCSAAMCIEKIAAWLSPPAAEAFWQAMQAETLIALKSVRPIDGVLALLQLLQHQQREFCVASAGNYEKMHTTLGATGILPNFAPRLFSAVDVAHSKPAPDLFLHAAKAMGFEPAQCVVIEDSLLGVQAALAAGMRVCWYVAERLAVVSALPDVRALDWSKIIEFSNMADLPALLGFVPGDIN